MTLEPSDNTYRETSRRTGRSAARSSCLKVPRAGRRERFSINRNLASPAIVSPPSELFEGMEKHGPRDLPAEIVSGVGRVAEMPAKTHT